MAAKKEPTEAQIQTGYMLHRAKERADKYAKQAVACAHVAAAEAKQNGEIPALLVMGDDIADIEIALGKFKKTLTKVHKSFRRRMKRAGYREITDAEFEKIGGGGGR